LKIAVGQTPGIHGLYSYDQIPGEWDTGDCKLPVSGTQESQIASIQGIAGVRDTSEMGIAGVPDIGEMQNAGE